LGAGTEVDEAGAEDGHVKEETDWDSRDPAEAAGIGTPLSAARSAPITRATKMSSSRARYRSRSNVGP
jgi:hypothetical protein